MKNLKRSCLSLAVITALGINANAVSLQESLVNGKFNGEIRSVTVMSSYTDSTEAGPYNNANSSAIALQLKYETADYHGFKAQVGFQAAHSFDLEDGNSGTADVPTFYNENESRVTQEGSNLYLANISYSTGNTEIRAGRQGISTPLMSISNANPLVDTFHGLSIINKDLPQTEVKFYVIKDWYERYSTDNKDRITHFSKPTYSLYVKNNSIDSLTVEAQYLAVTDEIGNPTDAPVATDDKYKTYFGALTYKLPTSIPLSIGGFYAVADYDSTTGRGYISDDQDTNMYGIKLGGKLGDTGFKIAYTKVDDDGDFIGNFGHVPNFFKYNGGQMFSDNFFAGVSSTSVMVIPKLIPGVFTLFAYSRYSQTDEGQANVSRGAYMDGASEMQADFRYKFGGSFKGLSTRLQIAQVDYNNPADADDKMTVGKLYLNYNF